MLPSTPSANEASDSGRTQKPRRYASLACDFCKKRHNKCDVKSPRCSLCERYDVPCTFTETKKRGRKRQFDDGGNHHDEQVAAEVLEQNLREKCCQTQSIAMEAADGSASCDTNVRSGLSAMATYLTRLQIGKPSRAVIEKFFECDLPAIFRPTAGAELPETQPRMWVVAKPSPAAPCSSDAASSPPSSADAPLPACCEVSRQLVGYAVLAHAALHSRQVLLAQQYLDKAEKFFVARSLIGLPVLNVAKGMLLMSLGFLSMGDIPKASSYSTLVLHHCKLMSKSLHALAQRQALSTATMTSQLEALRLAATTMLIASEDDPVEAQALLDSMRSGGAVDSRQPLDLLQLHLQALRVEVGAMLAAPADAQRTTRAALFLKTVDALVPQVERASLSCISRTSIDSLASALRAAVLLRTSGTAASATQAIAAVASAAQAYSSCGVCSLNHGLALAIALRVLQEIPGHPDTTRQALELLCDASQVHIGLRPIMERIGPNLLSAAPALSATAPPPLLPRSQQLLELRLFSPDTSKSAAAASRTLDTDLTPSAPPLSPASAPLPLDFNDFFSDFFADFLPDQGPPGTDSTITSVLP